MISVMTFSIDQGPIANGRGFSRMLETTFPQVIFLNHAVAMVVVKAHNARGVILLQRTIEFFDPVGRIGFQRLTMTA